MIRVRHARPNDRAAWLEMRGALWPDGPPAEHASEIDAFFAGELRDPRAVLLAEADGRIAGFAELSVRQYAEDCDTDRVAYLEGWYVDPDARRQGVGRALVEAAEAWAEGLGCSEFASDALLENTASAAAHRALGFAETERIRCFRKEVAPHAGSAPEADPIARTADILIRHATVFDAEALAALVTELGYPTSAEQMRGRLRPILPDPNYTTLLALVEGQVAGFIGAMVRPSYEADGLYGQIMALVVASACRRRGVGDALTGAIESMLARRGAGLVIVNTANHRADAHAFYESRGYTFTGRRYRKALAEAGPRPPSSA
jgi:aminoglycoside 6'-N-acetyltransferase I